MSSLQTTTTGWDLCFLVHKQRRKKLTYQKRCIHLLTVWCCRCVLLGMCGGLNEMFPIVSAFEHVFPRWWHCWRELASYGLVTGNSHRGRLGGCNDSHHSQFPLCLLFVSQPMSSQLFLHLLACWNPSTPSGTLHPEWTLFFSECCPGHVLLFQ